MPITVALLSPGAMGAAVAARLAANGATVLTSLAGRGPASVARAAAAGMIDAAPERLVSADLLLSIVPPGDALALARSLAPALAAAERKAVYVDCNALSPATKQAVAGIVAESGADFVDAAIIGQPPRADGSSPTFYAAGPSRDRLAPLAALGLQVRPIDGPVGAAAALKMAYAGINKGTAGLAVAMILAATRAGAAPALHDELGRSLPQPRAALARQVPSMYPKAYRWVAEMREIATFAGEDEAAAMIWEGLARLFERLAADVARDGRERALLDAFFAGEGAVSAARDAPETTS